MTVEMKPMVKPVPVEELRPTQMTVGYREVELKRKEIRNLSDKKAGTFLGHHFIPAVLGPKGRYHIVDHHHLARALHEEGVKEILITVIADLSALKKEPFLVFMDNRAWLHTFDAAGKRRDFSDLPKMVKDLADDPYRSLAGEVRRQGGYAKNNVPFSEFMWADYFRHNISAGEAEDDFDKAMKQAMKLAKSPEAGFLPGWCGPQDD
jgi:hypothetical protein